MGFPLFGNGRKTGEVENPREKFFSRAHKFFPPKSGGKARGENCLSAVLPLYPVLESRKKKRTERESAGVKKKERMRADSSKRERERERERERVLKKKKRERMRALEKKERMRTYYFI